MANKLVPVVYHVCIMLTFCVVYALLPGGFYKNFNVPEKFTKTPLDVPYYTMVVHSTAGFGDVFPITALSKLAVTLHLFLIVSATVFALF